MSVGSTSQPPLEPSCPLLVARITVGTQKQRERETGEAVRPATQALCYWPCLEGRGCLTIPPLPKPQGKICSRSQSCHYRVQALRGWSKGDTSLRGDHQLATVVSGGTGLWERMSWCPLMKQFGASMGVPRIPGRNVESIRSSGEGADLHRHCHDRPLAPNSAAGWRP